MRHWQQSAERVLAVAAVALAVCIVVTRVVAAGPPGHTVRVGFLETIAPTFDPATNPAHREFVEGLRELGYTLGRDVIVEYKSAQGNVTVLPQLAAELVSSKPDMLVASAYNPTLAAAKATKTVAIIMVGVTDVVETGLVASLAKPGGNITGLAINAAEIAAKRVQLLRDAVPRLSRVAVLWNATLPGMALAFQNIEKASPQLSVILQSVRVSGSDDFDQAFAAIESSHPEGLVVLYGPMRGNDRPRIVEFVTKHQIPTMFQPGQGVSGGGLMEFGPKVEPMFRRAAVYVDKIANGADPASLPVEEPSQFELVINLKAAKSMGIEVPHSLLLRADRVIE
jgi:putative tryptophan/tyrosine transport system substrate-binding protein